MQATIVPTTTAPADSVAAVRALCWRSGSLWSGAGLWSTRTTIGRFGVAGFIRSITASATKASATARRARSPMDSAVVERIDENETDANMNEPIVPPTPARQSADTRSLRFALPLLTIGWLVLVSVVLMSTVRIQRWEVAPGEALAVGPRISFAKTSGEVPTRYPADRGIHFVTALGAQLSVLDTVIGWIDPHVRVQTPLERFGPVSPSDSRRLGYQSMVGAKQIAEYVAMKRLGLPATLREGDVLVEQVVCQNKPARDAACDVLEVGDTIISFDGKSITTLTSLAAAMAGRKAGEKIELKVIPYDSSTKKKDPSKARTRTVELMADPDTPDRAIIGFVPADTRTVSLPFETSISTEGIGGPSAGLAFTLALIDELTEGNLMGEGKVVATGTMNEDGSVGAIGALEQKAVAVRERAASLFLVPAGQTADDVARARKAAGASVRIVQVATLAEALDALRANGGDPLPATAS